MILFRDIQLSTAVEVASNHLVWGFSHKIYSSQLLEMTQHPNSSFFVEKAQQVNVAINTFMFFGELITFIQIF